MIRRIRLPLAAVVAAAAALVGAGSAVAAAPAANCQPYGAQPCLLPFPNDLFTKVDHTTPTGLRVHLPAAAMPVNGSGSRIKVGDYDRADGFSPGSALIVHVGGVDLGKTGAVSLADMSKSFARKAPIVVIDETTGARQLIWAELDANATGSQNVNLLIHPGKNFPEGHTYVVALRNLRNAGGRLIKAPRWFALLRDGRRLPNTERGELRRYARIFTALTRAKIDRVSLYEAWDFTVASPRSLAGRMLAIRNSAFARLGDRNLADGIVQGHTPSFAITGQVPPADATDVRRVTGTSAFRATWSSAATARRPRSTTARASPMRCRRKSPATWRRRSLSASFRRPPAPPIRRGSRSMGTACSATRRRSRPAT